MDSDRAPDARRRLLAEGLLVTVTVFWGLGFPVMKPVLEELPVLAFLALRFGLAALLMAPVAVPRLGRLGWAGLARGVVLGVLLGLSFVFQTWGLARTSAANAGFLTGLCVVWVPLLAGPLAGKPPTAGALAGVALAVPGLFLLAGGGSLALGGGDLLVVIASGFIALHVIGLDVLTRGRDGFALAFVQIAVIALGCLAASLAAEPVTWPARFDETLVTALVVTAVFATVYAFWVQTAFQRWTTPTRAALIYILEPVFAALFAWGLLGERLSAHGWVGAGLILAAMAVSELAPAVRGRRPLEEGA